MHMVDNNVLIVGAGPIGSLLGPVVKAIEGDLNISIVDMRALPRRDHGLSIDRESIAKIKEVLNIALRNKPQSEHVKSLKNILEKWSTHFVRTNEIEITLGNLCKEMNIQVFRGPDYEVTEDDLSALNSSSSNLNPSKKKLRALLTAASVVIAADGALSTNGTHRTIREMLGIKLVDEEALKYIAQLKYQTEGETEPRGKIEASTLSSKTGFVTRESMSRQKTEEKKPATFFAFIDGKTHEALKAIDEFGIAKGSSGNPWKLNELKERAQVDMELADLYDAFERHVENLKRRGGSCTDEKISALELKIYRAETSVKWMFGKYILCIGDSNSGLILERGFNKGLKEVALCAKAVSEFFKRQSEEGPYKASERLSIPAEFKIYEYRTKELFEAERSIVYNKNTLINVGRFFARSSAKSIHFAEASMGKMSGASAKVPSSSTGYSLSSFFSKLLWKPRRESSMGD